MINKNDYVIVRCRDAGVHAGFYESHDGREVHLTHSRRLWRWRVRGAAGISLSDVATMGLDPDNSRICAQVASIHVLDACEIILCTAAAAQMIQAAPTYDPSK